MSSSVKLQVLLEAKDNLSASLSRVKNSFQSSDQALEKYRNQLGDVSKASRGIERFQTLNDQLNVNQAKLKVATKKFEEYQKQIKSTKSPSDQLLLNFEKTSKSLNTVSKALDKNKKENLSLQTSLRASGVDTENLCSSESKLRRRQEELTASFNKQSVALDKVNARRKKLKNALIGGASAFAVGRGTKAMVSRATGDYLDLEKSTGNLRTISGGNEGYIQETQRIGQEMQRKYAGVTKTAVMEAAYNIKSGISQLGPEALAEVTKHAVMTSKATKADAPQMTSLFASAFGIWKETDEFKKSSDIDFSGQFSGALAKSIDLFKTDGAQMQQAIQSMGGGINLAFDELIASVGILQQQMDPSVAGNAVKKLSERSAKAHTYFSSINDGRQSVRFLDENTGGMLPLLEILKSAQSRYGEKLNEVDKAELLKGLGSSEAVKVFVGLMDKVKLLETRTWDIRNAREDGTNVTSDMANKADDNRWAEITKFWQKISDLKDAFAKALMPALTGFAKSLSPHIMSLTNFMNKLSESQPTFSAIVAILGTIGTALAGVSFAFGLLSALVPGLASSFSILGTASFILMSPFRVLKFLAAGMFSPFGRISKIVTSVGLLSSAFKGLVSVFKLISKGLMFGFRFNPVIGTIMALVQIGAYLYTTFKGVTAVTEKIIKFKSWVGDKRDNWFDKNDIKRMSEITSSVDGTKGTIAPTKIQHESKSKSSTINATINVYAEHGMNENNLVAKIKDVILNLQIEAEAQNRSDIWSTG